MCVARQLAILFLTCQLVVAELAMALPPGATRSPQRAISHSRSSFFVKSKNRLRPKSRAIRGGTAYAPGALARLNLDLVGAAGLRGRVKFRSFAKRDSGGSVEQYGGTISSRRLKSAPLSITLSRSFLGGAQGRAWFMLPTRRGSPVYYSVVFSDGGEAPRVVRTPVIALSRFRCPVHGDLAQSSFIPSKLGGRLDARLGGLNTLRQIEIATDTDAEFAARYGDQTKDIISYFANAVDVIYRPQLGATLKLVNQKVTTDVSTYPVFMLDAEDLHDRFTGRDLGPSDANILFSGKDFDGATVGLAWVGGACDSGFKYGIIQDINQASTPVVVAHELAHLLSAQHDEDVGCGGSGIMSAVLHKRLPTIFSQCSVKTIENFFSTASCLATVSGDDPDPSPLGPTVAISGRITSGSLFTGKVRIGNFIQGCEVFIRASRSESKLATGRILTNFFATSAQATLTAKLDSKSTPPRAGRSGVWFLGATLECSGSSPSVTNDFVRLYPYKVKVSRTEPVNRWFDHFGALLVVR